MSSQPLSSPERRSEGSHQTEVVAGYLASIAIFAGLISLAWHPIRLLGPALLLSLVSAGMTGRGRRLPFAAVLTVAVCFFLAMMITVITGRPLW